MQSPEKALHWLVFFTREKVLNLLQRSNRLHLGLHHELLGSWDADGSSCVVGSGYMKGQPAHKSVDLIQVVVVVGEALTATFQQCNWQKTKTGPTRLANA